MNHEFLGFLPYLFGSFTDANHQSVHPLWFEVAYWLLVLLVFCVASPLHRACTPLTRAFARFATHRGPAVCATFLLSVFGRVALLPWIPIPDPAIHDEFSYILQAKTLALGRLTNPTHPMWQFFETYHVNMVPTYESMYPPGQGVALAASVWLTHQPWWGVLIVVGLMCAAVTWMLQGWMAPRWALLGGLLVVLRWSFFSYWVNGYFGGQLAALAGALLLGLYPRMKRELRWWHGPLLGLSLLVLANTRAYEGLVLCVPVMFGLLWWLWQQREQIRRTVPALALFAAVLVAGFGAVGYYNYKGTGNPRLMPYWVNHEQYHITYPLFWQKANPIPKYRHATMRRTYVFWELPDYLNVRQPGGLQEMLKTRATAYYQSMFWPLGIVVLLGLRTSLKNRKSRLLALCSLGVVAAASLVIWYPLAHYVAPALAAFVALAILGLRTLGSVRLRNVRVGRNIVTAALFVLLGWTAVRVVMQCFDPYSFNAWAGSSALRQEFERERVKHILERMPGKHLVIIHFRRSYDGHRDWVYNEPDIDASKIAWARDMGSCQNRELTQYFGDRQVWHIDQADGIIMPHPALESPGVSIPKIAGLTPPSIMQETSCSIERKTLASAGTH